MGAALLLFESFGLFSLMIAVSLKHFVHASISAVLLWRRLDGFGSQRMAITILKTVTASLIMTAAALATLPYLSDLIGSTGIVREALLVIVCALLYGSVFMMAARLLGLSELAWLWNLLRRRIAA